MNLTPGGSGELWKGLGRVEGFTTPFWVESGQAGRFAITGGWGMEVAVDGREGRGGGLGQGWQVTGGVEGSRLERVSRGQRGSRMPLALVAPRAGGVPVVCHTYREG